MKFILYEIKTGIATFFSFIFLPFSWIAASFQDENGKTSGSRLTAWFLTMLTGYFVAYNKITDYYTLLAFVALLASLLVIWGIISWKDLENMASIFAKKEDKPEDKPQDK